MHKKIFVLSISVLLVLCAIFYFNKSNVPAPKESIPNISSISRLGEEILYDIELNKVFIGQAKFTQLPPEELDGAMVDVAKFETNIVSFSDVEKIYSDPKTFLPLRVEREVIQWPMKEKIIEYYDQKNFSVRIKKIEPPNGEDILIKRDSPLQHGILLPFYLRNISGLNIGWTFLARLPKDEFTITLISKEKIRVPAGEFDTYHFESSPKKFEVWITTDEYKTPVKIKGSGVFNHVLNMKKHTIR